MSGHVHEWVGGSVHEWAVMGLLPPGPSANLGPSDLKGSQAEHP